MDLRKVKKLMELLEESGIAEIEIKEGEESIRLSRSKKTVDIPQPGVIPKTPLSKEDTEKIINKGVDVSSQTTIKGNTINSPMVGTFYRAPSPDSKVFVEVGQQIKKGDTVCILEAMKMMNQVTSDFDGTIKEILIEDSEPVEYGQPLFIVE